MPRDSGADVVAEVELPGVRKGRVVETIQAGQFVVQVVGCDWIARLAGAGALSRDQVDGAQFVALLFEEAGVRPHLAIGYEPVVVDGAGGDDFLERLTGRQLRAWRRLHRLLAAAPLCTRGEVEAVCCWDQRPISIPRLRAGLDAIARAIRRPRRR